MGNNILVQSSCLDIQLAKYENANWFSENKGNPIKWKWKVTSGGWAVPISDKLKFSLISTLFWV